MAAVSATATAKAAIALSVNAWLQSNIIGAQGSEQFLVDLVANLVNGTGAGQCDRVWYGDRTLAGGASENHDIVGGLTDALGNAISFLKVKCIIVKNTAADGVDGEFGPVTAGNGFGIGGVWKAAADKSIVPGGGYFFWYDPNGAAAVAGTADLLTMINLSGGTALTYRTLLIGTSA